MCDLHRKLPLRRNHFFVWLKTANFSTACGRATLKSPPSRAFSVPHVHPRLRKHLSRCTLDCGFKTPESPALRGFVAERCPITGTSLYLVLKSNGLPRPKIRLKKFGFSSKSVPANIAKKLPPQRCFKPLFIAFFNFSHKRPTFAFAGESGEHTRLRSKNRTQRLTRRNRGPSLLRTQRGFAPPAKSPPKEQPEKTDARQWRASAFLRRRGPTGLRCPNCQSVHTVYLSLQIVRDSLPICRILARFT